MDDDEKRRKASEYGKAYYAAHRAEILARQIARNATEHAKAINRKAVAKYRKTHTEERKVYAATRRAAKLDEIRQQDREAKKRWYAANTDEGRRRAQAYGASHPKAVAARAAEWRKANPERVEELSIKGRQKRKEQWAIFLERERERYRRAYVADPGKYSAKGAKRRCAQLRATPPWADLVAMVDIYRRAQEITRETGIKHDVYHIIPLRGKTVWGLHIPINLQILTSTENRQKFNRLTHGATKANHAPIRASSVAGKADRRQSATHRRGSASPGREVDRIDVAGLEASAD